MEEGSITIDGIDLSTIPRQEVRGRLNTVAQDLCSPSQSLRHQIDPFDISTDEAIIQALEKVGLWSIFEPQGGLDEDLAEGLLSVGQRQLLGIARALVRPGKIVILDEATSSLDPESDKMVQRLLKEEFADRTVIHVAHKLDSVMEFDRIFVMSNGRIVENGNPRELMETPGSALKALFDAMH